MLMSAKVWTPAQLEAITAHGNNLLVSAAAGAGKTSVLVERIVRRVTDPDQPIDIDTMLVVTFTNAAAAEMRQRVGILLAQARELRPGDERLARQVALLTRAPITTIHSFCLDVIRQHFHQLDLDPAFRVADDTEAALLRQDALDDLFEKRYASGDSAFLELADRYGGSRDDTVLQETVIRLHNFAHSQPQPYQWLADAAAAFRLDPECNIDTLRWTDEVRRHIRITLQGSHYALTSALAHAEAPGGPTVYAPIIREDLAKLSGLVSAVDEDWNTLRNAFAAMSFQRLPSCRDHGVNPEVRDDIKKLRDKAKKAVSALTKDFFTRSVADLLGDIVSLAPAMDTMVQLVQDFGVTYAAMKRTRALLDFHDLEHLCLKLLKDPSSSPEQLRPSPTAEELQARFTEVLVDEYQDVNAVQEAILQLVSRQQGTSPNLFMVGDVKQSIYRFRLAEPALFLQKYAIYGCPESGGLRIDLPDNFRCRPEVVDAVNFVFRQVMTPGSAEISYDDQAALVCRAAYPPPGEGAASVAGPVEVHLFEQAPEAVPFEIDEGEPDALQSEARAVARRLRHMVEEECPCVYDPNIGEYRSLAYRDIVVLLRATRGPANVFLDEFRDQGLPAYADLGTGYFGAVEVQTILALLQIIDNPRQDIPLATVLRSPICGLSAENLANIRLAAPRGDFWDAVCAAAAAEAPPAPALRKFLRDLEYWRTLARRGGVADLLWTLYQTTGYEAYVRGLPGGAQRLANLRALYDRARQFEHTSLRGLFRFLRFIKRLQDEGQDLGTAAPQGEDEDLVRVMSIHRAKGLEFPVVVVAGLARQFNRADHKTDILLHKQLGLGPTFVDPQARLSYPTLARHAIAYRIDTENLAEELRLLYVAMTRARERLLLFGSLRRLDNAVKHWCRCAHHTATALPEAELLAARCPLDWLGAALIRHPCAEPLLQTVQTAPPSTRGLAGDPSKWIISVNGGDDEISSPRRYTLPSKLNTVRDGLAVPGLESTTVHAVTRALDWRYPYSAAISQPAKVAATQIKQLFGPYFITPARRPQFMLESGDITAMERGSAYHMVIQHLDLRQPLDILSIEKQIKAMVSRELLLASQAAAVDPEVILSFLSSPLGQRMIGAQAVYRELPFTLAIPAAELSNNEADLQGEPVLVQGIIDCLIEEEMEGSGGMMDRRFVLIDFKTDQTGHQSVAAITARYQGQINLYARAVQAILKRPVVERYLYLFDCQQAVPL